MTLNSSSTPAEIVAEAKRISQAVLAEHADRTDRERRFPRESIEALTAAGLLGLTVPAEHGGLGRGPQVFTQVVEELALTCGSTAMIYVMHISATACLLARPDALVVEQFIKPIAAGSCLTTLAFSEFGSGAHFYAPVSQAARRNGDFVLNCDKSFVTSAGEADLYVVSTRATNAAAATESDLFIVTREQAATYTQVSEAWAGMGLNGNSSAPMKFSECVVPAGQLLGREGEGLGLMLQTVLPIFSLGIAAVNLGLAEAALRASVAHANSRRYEHSGGTLAEIETIQHLVAEMKLSIDRTRALVGATAELVEAGDPQATLPVLEIKAAACETALEVTAKAMRVCGGAAYSRRLPVERFFRDSQAGNVMAPTTDILKGFIGKAVLGL